MVVKVWPFIVALALTMTACGGSSPSGSTPTEPTPDYAATWVGSYTGALSYKSGRTDCNDSTHTCTMSVRLQIAETNKNYVTVTVELLSGTCPHANYSDFSNYDTQPVRSTTDLTVQRVMGSSSNKCTWKNSTVHLQRSGTGITVDGVLTSLDSGSYLAILEGPLQQEAT